MMNFLAQQKCGLTGADGRHVDIVVGDWCLVHRRLGTRVGQAIVNIGRWVGRHLSHQLTSHTRRVTICTAHNLSKLTFCINKYASELKKIQVIIYSIHKNEQKKTHYA